MARQPDREMRVAGPKEQLKGTGEGRVHRTERTLRRGRA